LNFLDSGLWQLECTGHVVIFCLLILFSAVEATRKGAFNFFGKNLSTNGWSDLMPQIAGLQRQVSEICSGFNKKPHLNNAIDLKSFPLFISHDCGKFGSHLLHVRKGSEDNKSSAM
jgi:hypothetical protein